MKRLTSRQTKSLIRMVSQTREREFNCAECLKHVSELVEREATGLPLDDVLGRVEHHLGMCPECREEYEALLKVLRASE
jgi:predicted anti-sigma-YlaC factor YlaD